MGINEGALTRIADVAKTFDISKNHLMKIVHDLGQKGYLDNVRGRNGDIRLRRKPQDINVGQVMRDIEDDLDVLGCLGQTGYCQIDRVSCCAASCAMRRRRSWRFSTATRWPT